MVDVSTWNQDIQGGREEGKKTPKWMRRTRGYRIEVVVVVVVMKEGWGESKARRGALMLGDGGHGTERRKSVSWGSFAIHEDFLGITTII